MNWNMGSLMDLATAYWKSAALQAGVELNLFGAVRMPATAAAVSAAVSAPADYVFDLLDALAAMGLLVKEGDTYRLEPSAAPFLDPTNPVNILAALQFNADLYPLWGRLGETVRHGTPALPPQAHLGDDPARTRRFAMGMHGRALGLAPMLLPALEATGVSGRVLDLACGPGTFGRLWAERAPAMQLTQFDLPAVLAVARELAAASPAAPRLRFVSGDYRRDPLPGGFDAVFYCGALHQENEATARALFASIRGALAGGGRVVVVDLMCEAARTAPVFANLFSLNMRLTSPFGRVFTVPQTCALLEAAGFEAAEGRMIPHIPYALVTAQRKD